MTYTPDIRDVMHAAHYRYSPGQCEESLAAHDAEVRAQALAPIRAALAGHPSCDIHPDDDPIACGWKRAVASVQAVLDKEDR